MKTLLTIVFAVCSISFTKSVFAAVEYVNSKDPKPKWTTTYSDEKDPKPKWTTTYSDEKDPKPKWTTT